MDDKKHSSCATASIIISVVIPAYNEEERLIPTLKSVVSYLRSRNRKFEVLVVDDGSTDKTAVIAQELAASLQEIKVLQYGQNRGKGYAVRYGVQHSIGEYVLFNDADGSSPIEGIELLFDAIKNGAQIAIGSRAMNDSNTTISTVWYRRAIGRVFNLLANILVIPGIKDTQCGFKMFTKKAANYVFSRQRAERFSFDVELLFIGRKGGLKITEVPINWVNIPGSKVRFGLDPLQMFFDMLRFRWNDICNRYR